MNTFGMKKKGQSPFWLKGGVRNIIKKIWRDVLSFSVTIKRTLINKVEL